MGSADDDPEGIALRLPVATASVRAGRLAAAHHAQDAGCDEETLWCIRLAVSEAISNVVIHAHPGNPDPSLYFDLALRRADGCLVITVSDHGSGDLSASATPGIGKGLKLIAGITEAHDINARPGLGTIVAMTFLIGHTVSQ